MRTDSPEQRFTMGSVYFTDPIAGRTLKLESGRWHQGRLLAVFAEIPDRNAAEDARGTLLWLDVAEIEAPEDPDEFNDFQLVGLDVVTVEGEHVGKIVRIDHAPASDLLVITWSDGRIVLLPFVTSMVPTVDIAGGRVVINPPDGLLDL
ncbi:ribosome maturation factor RimM [Allocatelliglobosispora scoriae]